MRNYDDLSKEFIIKLFKEVGLNYTYNEIIKYCKDDPEWYLLNTWTEKQENEFRNWMEKRLGKQNKDIKYKEVIVYNEIL